MNCQPHILFNLERKVEIKSTLLSGEMLSNGKMLSSLNGHYHLWMQPDGDLELYKKENDKKGSNRKVIWASRTTGAGDPPYTLLLVSTRLLNQLVIEDGGSNIIWSTGTKVSNNNKWIAGGYATIQENGNFVLYDGRNKTMWTSDTVDGKKSSVFGTGKIHGEENGHFVHSVGDNSTISSSDTFDGKISSTFAPGKINIGISSYNILYIATLCYSILVSIAFR